MNKKRFKKLFEIFITTFKVGMFTFGGGLAMIPIIQREFVEKRGYVSSDEIIDMLAVAQSLPGVISVNASVLIGAKMEKTAGGIMAGLGCMLPSVIILSIVTVFYTVLIENIYIQGALKGVSGAVVALFLSIVAKLRKQSMEGTHAVLLFFLALIFALFFKWINVIFLIITGGILGVIFNIKRLQKENIDND